MVEYPVISVSFTSYHTFADACSFIIRQMLTRNLKECVCTYDQFSIVWVCRTNMQCFARTNMSNVRNVCLLYISPSETLLDHVSYYVRAEPQ